MEEDWDAEMAAEAAAPKAVISSSYAPAAASSSSSSSFSFGRGRLLDKFANNRDNRDNRDRRDSNPFRPRRENDDSSRERDQNRDRYRSGGGGGWGAEPSRDREQNNRERGGGSDGWGPEQSNRDRDRDRGQSMVGEMEIDARQVSAVIGRQGATVSNIRETCSVRVDVPRREDIGSSRTVKIKITGSSWHDIDRAKAMILQVVDVNNNNSSGGGFRTRDSSSGMKREQSNSYEEKERKRSYTDYNETTEEKKRETTYNTKPSSSNQTSVTTSSWSSSTRTDETKDKEVDSSPFGTIDWAAVRAQPLQNMSKFKDHPPVIKDFYIEDEEVKAMTLEEVKQFRQENFNIMVELFKKEDLSYGFGKYEADTRTPEEIEAYLFERVPNPVRSIEQAFRNFPEILDECKRQNFVKPTPIQAQMWPILLKGLDCIGIAQTGTGKTLAFLLPALIHIDRQTTPREKRIGPNVLVLSPTRELAVQIEQEVKKINYKGIKSVCVYGGVDRKEQINVCTKGVEIIIATPGRLYDLMQAGVINVTSVTYLVMDEADRMLDMGFEPQIMKILLDIRPDRQTVMTSATWPPGVRRLATKYLLEPIQLYVGTLDLRAAKTVNQVIKLVQSEDEKKQRLLEYITAKMDHENDKLIVFVGRKSMADNLSCDLAMKNISCQSIHGDREQCDREDALEDFKTGAVRILIATDVASRGIDVKDITCVLNYDFPRNIEEYVHRVGRTGRAGRTGTAVTFVAREDWKHAQELIDILKQGEQEVPQGLFEMAERYEAMKKRRAEEGRSSFSREGGGGGFGGGGFGGGGGRRGGGRGGRGGRGGGDRGFFF